MLALHKYSICQMNAECMTQEGQIKYLTRIAMVSQRDIVFLRSYLQGQYKPRLAVNDCFCYHMERIC